jgi:hypothetical protein
MPRPAQTPAYTGRSPRGPATDRTPRLTHSTAWLEHAGTLPIIEGAVILLTVDWLRLRRDRENCLALVVAAASQRRRDRPALAGVPVPIDIEHTFRTIKKTLGWTSPKRRDPHVADRWT